MKYKINELAKLSGVSTRTLRYYDQIDLLKPERTEHNDYRVYEQTQVDLLQHILFYRELGVPLEEIKTLISSNDFEKSTALENHLITLLNKKDQIEKLIENVRKTIKSEKEGTKMTNKEKFEGFKEQLISENEQKYGNEIRQKYGDTTIDGANAKIKKMNENSYKEMEHIATSMNETLKEAFAIGNPSGELAQKACDFHKELLLMTWPDGTYSKESHLALVESFVDDERFVKYYDKIAKGCIKFLVDATKVYCS